MLRKIQCDMGQICKSIKETFFPATRSVHVQVGSTPRLQFHTRSSAQEWSFVYSYVPSLATFEAISKFSIVPAPQRPIIQPTLTSRCIDIEGGIHLITGDLQMSDDENEPSPTEQLIYEPTNHCESPGIQPNSTLSVSTEDGETDNESSSLSSLSPDQGNLTKPGKNAQSTKRKLENSSSKKWKKIKRNDKDSCSNTLDTGLFN